MRVVLLEDSGLLRDALTRLLADFEASILGKLRLPPSQEDHRRVLAVLA